MIHTLSQSVKKYDLPSFPRWILFGIFLSGQNLCFRRKTVPVLRIAFESNIIGVGLEQRTDCSRTLRRHGERRSEIVGRSVLLVSLHNWVYSPNPMSRHNIGLGDWAWYILYPYPAEWCCSTVISNRLSTFDSLTCHWLYHLTTYHSHHGRALGCAK